MQEIFETLGNILKPDNNTSDNLTIGYTIKLNGTQKHIPSKEYSSSIKMLFHDILNLFNIYGSGDPPTKDAVMLHINGDAFEIGNSDYTMSIETDKINESSEPLYKILNEQRTKGFVEVTGDASGKLGTDLTLKIKGNNSFDIMVWGDTKEVATIDAQYTALAVNNLYILAEVLDEIIKYEDRMRANNDPKISNHWYNKAKEALKHIS